MCPASDAVNELPRARMGVRGSGPHHWNALEALPVSLVLLVPPYRRCAITCPSPADRSCGDGWSLIDSSLGQKCPRYAGVLIGKGDDDEHGRLTREHPAQPRRG